MISVKDFTKQNVEEVLTVATRMKELVAKKGGCDVLNVFFIGGFSDLAPRYGQRVPGTLHPHCFLFQRCLLQIGRKGDYHPRRYLLHQEGRDPAGYDALRPVLLGCVGSSSS